jgi:predicted CoA-binding protein
MASDLNDDENARRDVILHSTTVAIVGRSNDHYYSSYQVGEYLEQHGYTVYSVNPNLDEIGGEPSYPSLKDVPRPIDIVDVFRRSEFLSSVVDDAIAIGAKTVWAQLGVFDVAARNKALAAGLNVAMDLCLRTEHERIFSPPPKE